MLVHIGIFIYMLITNCPGNTLGATIYPLNDNNGQSRIICISTKYGPYQTKEVFVHELIHACLHNHEHHFKTKQELENHVDTVPEQSEEELVDSLAYCMVPVLENKDVQQFLGLSKADIN